MLSSVFAIYCELAKAPTKTTHHTTLFPQQHEPTRFTETTFPGVASRFSRFLYSFFPQQHSPARFTETTSPGVVRRSSGFVNLLLPIPKCGKHQRHYCMGVQSDSRINTKTRNKNLLMRGWPPFINPPTMTLQLSPSTVLVVIGKAHGLTKAATSG